METAFPTHRRHTHPALGGPGAHGPVQTRNLPKTGAAEGVWTEVDPAGLGIPGREPRTGCV